jgi:GTP-binding protein
VVLVVNKVDRSDARPEAVVNEVYELFLDLDADESQIEFPIVYANAREGRAGFAPDELAHDLGPLVQTLLATVPPPSYDPEHPLQALVTNLDASPYVGRLALLRIQHGTIRRGQQVAWCRADGTIENARVTELYVTEALDRVPADEAGPGEIVALAGLPEVTIGETIADPDDPRPAPGQRRRRAVAGDDARINTSPLAGHRGRQGDRERADRPLEQELVGNVSLRVSPTAQAGGLGGAGPRRAAARGARRDHAPRGLRADRRQARSAHARARRHAHEPVERVAIDVPEEYIGVVTQLLSLRKGRLQRWSTTAPAGRGWSTSRRRAA